MGVGSPRRQHALAGGGLASVVRRAVDVHRQLGAAIGLMGQRAVWAPHVLADADADLHPTDDVELERVGLVAGREVAGLVEHGVVRQQALAVRAEDPSAGAHRGGVEEVAIRLHEADHRGAVAGDGGELGERDLVVGDEARLEDEILRRVAGRRQLREGDEVAARRLGPLVGVDEQRQVAVDVADHRVQLGQRDAQHGHDGEANRCELEPDVYGDHDGVHADPLRDRWPSGRHHARPTRAIERVHRDDGEGAGRGVRRRRRRRRRAGGDRDRRRASLLRRCRSVVGR